VTAELLDPAKKTVTFVGINAGSDKVAALPWSQVQAIHQPNDELTTAMTPQAIAAAPALSQKASGNAVDVNQNLIGREVTAADGSKRGTVSDIVVEMKSGKLDYPVVDPTGIHLGATNAPHAVPWNDVKSVAGDKSQPVTVSLTSQQLVAQPVFGGSKAEETEAGRVAAAKGCATL
jgi:sporulation protein YlmC with PRC-barrel domain